MSAIWICNSEKPLINECDGKVVLVRLKDVHKGITHTCDQADEDFTIDLSWMRMNGKVCATEGKYDHDDIHSWSEI